LCFYPGVYAKEPGTQRMKRRKRRRDWARVKAQNLGGKGRTGARSNLHRNEPGGVSRSSWGERKKKRSAESERKTNKKGEVKKRDTCRCRPKSNVKQRCRGLRRKTIVDLADDFVELFFDVIRIKERAKRLVTGGLGKQMTEGVKGCSGVKN